MVLLDLLLIGLFVSFSLGEAGRLSLSNGISIGLLDLLIPALFIFWFLKIRKGNYRLTKPILLFTGVGIFSLFINFKNFSIPQLEISSLYLIRWVIYTSVYFVFVDIGKKFAPKINKYLLYSGLAVTLIGLAQFFIYPSLRNLYYLGWDEHLYRLFGTFLDPNFTGAILVLFFVFLFILRDKIFSDKRLGYIVLLANFVGIVLTYSRGALLMFITCALIYSILTRNWKLIASVIIIFAGIFLVLSPRFYLENTNLLRTVSTKERLATSQKALSIWKKNPFGVGFDTYRYSREKYGEIDKSKFGPSHSGAGVDNSLILVLVTTGIEGLIIYLYLLRRMFRIGLENIKANKYGLILIVSLAGLIVNSLTINSLFYSFIMVWIWILAGLTESNLRE